jgi:hypothetical protein
MPGDHLLAELEAGPSNAKNRRKTNLNHIEKDDHSQLVVFHHTVIIDIKIPNQAFLYKNFRPVS